MFKTKTAQGMSIKIIIVAIISLIVLIAVVIMFSGKFGDFSGGIKSVGDPTKTCQSQTGHPPEEDCDSNNEISILSKDAGAKGMKCCTLTSSAREEIENCLDGCTITYRHKCPTECGGNIGCIVGCERAYAPCREDC